MTEDRKSLEIKELVEDAYLTFQSSRQYSKNCSPDEKEKVIKRGMLETLLLLRQAVDIGYRPGELNFYYNNSKNIPEDIGLSLLQIIHIYLYQQNANKCLISELEENNSDRNYWTGIIEFEKRRMETHLP